MNLREKWERRVFMHKQAEEDQKKQRRRHRENEIKQQMLRIEQRKVMRQLQYLRHARHGKWSPEQRELNEKLVEIRAQMEQLRFEEHLHPFRDGDEVDFNHYYRHFQVSRLFVLIFNLLLWGLLFWFSGLATGLKVVTFVFALLTTVGSLFEIVFQTRITGRILKPIDSLQKAVQEVARGNFDVKVENSTPNEISPLIRAFNEMAAQLRESEKVKLEYEENRKTLIANISHDLKTPITSIQGYLELLDGDEPISEEKRERYFRIIRSNTAYMNRLIEDLFLFSKLDMQKLDFHFEETPIRPFLSDMMQEFRLDLEERGVVFEYRDTLPKDFSAKLDGRRFHQILQNLIGNAVRYGVPGRRTVIWATLYENEGFLKLEIADNGPGIPPEVLPHVFERFYRADAERTKHLESTGLGLAIAKELAEAHGGSISAASEVGKGACFTVSFPISKGTSEEK